MRSIDKPLEWIQGKREKGCTYHTLSRARWNGDTIQIDVFVMPSISASRPIAITVGLYRDYHAVEKHKSAIMNTQELDAAAKKTSQALVSLGVSLDTAVLRASEVSKRIQRDAKAISAAML